MFLSFTPAWEKAVTGYVDPGHLLNFRDQIFTEHLLRAKENMYCVVSRRNRRSTRQSFITDAYNIAGDRRYTQTETHTCTRIHTE